MSDASRELIRSVEAAYGMAIDVGESIAAGDESEVFKGHSICGPVVIRVAPAWRSLEELAWAYELATYAANEIPEVLAPCRARDGSFVFEHNDRVVSVFPFVHGEMLDRTNAQERDSAARLLARLHRVLPAWPAATPRPASRPGAPTFVPSVDPSGFADGALDAAVERLAATTHPALTHGDYYRGNVRCVDGRIVALFDWDDACYWTLENELAWSLWELTQADGAATLDVDRAQRFLEAYAAAGGPVPLGSLDFIVPFIRDDLRTEIREAAAMAEAGLTVDHAYVNRARSAFAALADLSLELGSDSIFIVPSQ